MTDTKLRYFAYGSNMLEARLRARVPSCTYVAVGRLSGYVLKFHKVGRDGSAKCSILRTDSTDDYVLGVVYEFDLAERGALDSIEGLGRGYDDATVELETTSGPISAYCYIADERFIDDNLKPRDWYLDYVIRGAREHGFPEEYIAILTSTPAETVTPAVTPLT